MRLPETIEVGDVLIVAYYGGRMLRKVTGLTKTKVKIGEESFARSDGCRLPRDSYHNVYASIPKDPSELGSVHAEANRRQTINGIKNITSRILRGVDDRQASFTDPILSEVLCALKEIQVKMWPMKQEEKVL